MAISPKSLILSRLRDPALYGLLILIALLFYGERQADASLTLVFLAAYLIVQVLVEVLFSVYTRNTAAQSAPSFVTLFERYVLVFFALVCALTFIAGFVVLKRPLIDTAIFSSMLFALAVPKNISFAARLFTMVARRQFSPEESIRLAATETVIINSNELTEKSLSLQDIVTDGRVYHITDFPTDTKIANLIVLSSGADASSLVSDIAQLKKECPQVAKPENKNEMHFSFYSYDGKNMALLEGDPGAVLERCDFIEEEAKVKRLSFGAKKNLMRMIQDFVREDRHARALAYKAYGGKKLENPSEEFVFVGFLLYEYAPKKELAGLITLLRTLNMRTIILSSKPLAQLDHIATELGLLREGAHALAWDASMRDGDLLDQLSASSVIGKSTPQTEKRLLALFGKNVHVLKDMAGFESFMAALEGGKQYLSNIASFARAQLIFSLSLLFLMVGSFLYPVNFPFLSFNSMLFLSLVLFSFPYYLIAFEKSKPLPARILPKRLLFNKVPLISLLTALAIVLLAMYSFSSFKSAEAPTAVFLTFIGLHAFTLLSTRSLNSSFISSISSRSALLPFLLFIVVFALFALVPAVGSYFDLIALRTPAILFIILIAMGILIVEEVRKLIIKI